MISYLEEAGRPAPSEEWALTLADLDRRLVNALAAIYEQATVSVLAGAETERVLLCAPEGRGVTGLLARRALKCVHLARPGARLAALHGRLRTRLRTQRNRIGVNQVLAVKTPEGKASGMPLRARDWR